MGQLFFIALGRRPDGREEVRARARRVRDESPDYVVAYNVF